MDPNFIFVVFSLTCIFVLAIVSDKDDLAKQVLELWAKLLEILAKLIDRLFK